MLIRDIRGNNELDFTLAVIYLLTMILAIWLCRLNLDLLLMADGRRAK